MSFTDQAEQTVGRCQSSGESELSNSRRCPSSSRKRCDTRMGVGIRNGGSSLNQSESPSQTHLTAIGFGRLPSRVGAATVYLT